MLIVAVAAYIVDIVAYVPMVGTWRRFLSRTPPRTVASNGAVRTIGRTDATRKSGKTT